jgi:carbonic anhydrase
MSSITNILLLAASVSPVLGFCGGHTHLDKRAEGEVPINTFGYTGATGPLLWDRLEPANSLCSTGTHQSPIDMTAGSFNMVGGGAIGLTMTDVPGGATFENLGTTVEVIMEGTGSSLTLGDGVVRNLLQFHFHHPSEHLDDGVSRPMEMHMVFSSEADEIAVIGMYINIEPTAAATTAKRALSRRAPSPLLETVFANVEAIAEPGTKTTTGALLMNEIAAAVTAGGLQSYSGSLTTPPCSEEVSWLVSTAQLTISEETYTRATNILGYNSRFPQNSLGAMNLIQMARAP